MKSIKVFTIALVFSVLGLNNVFSQGKDDPVLMTIAGRDVTKSEFENIYKKNASKDAPVDKKSLDEYLELFVNFKLKVSEAMELGLDTTKAFTEELEGYRKQLAQPYLVDKNVSEKLVQEVYDRMKVDVRASHILIRVGETASPKDTLEAYNKAKKIRQRILNGEDFVKVAKETSEDPSVKDNDGDLGYFPPLKLVYPFESAAFNAKVNDITAPVRTKFGYHIIKITDRREPALGELKVAHIMVKANSKMSEEQLAQAKQKIDEIYSKLKSGEDFAKLAKNFSDDKGSAKKGGELPWFGTSRMILAFEQAAYAIGEKGGISEPVKTAYGWHIIKLIDKKELVPFEDIKGEIKAKVARDSRSQLSTKALISQIKKESKYKVWKKSKEAFYTVLDSTYFEGKWNVEKASSLSAKLFKLGPLEFSQKDFARYISENQSRKKESADIMIEVNKLFNEFVDNECIKFEDSRLSEKYPEFRLLMQEYHDGILLFELMDKKVWSKAVKDTSGLRAYYEDHKNEYMWKERLDAQIYTCQSAEIASQTMYLLDRGITGKLLVDSINSASRLNLKVEGGKFQREENDVIDQIEWKKGRTRPIEINGASVFVVVNDVLEPSPKTLKESKGLVTADYQSHLEKEWIAELRKKYPFEIKNEVLSTVQ